MPIYTGRAFKLTCNGSLEVASILDSSSPNPGFLSLFYSQYYTWQTRLRITNPVLPNLTQKGVSISPFLFWLILDDNLTYLHNSRTILTQILFSRQKSKCLSLTNQQDTQLDSTQYARGFSTLIFAQLIPYRHASALLIYKSKSSSEHVNKALCTLIILAAKPGFCRHEWV